MTLLSPQLEAFIAVSKHKTVHAAADALFMTQTAITQRIRVLESKLSTTLFVRSRRGMLLTPEGQALLHYCEAATDLESQVIANIRGGTELSEIRVALSGPTSMMHARIIPHCLPVINAFPNLLLHFNVSDQDNIETLLRSGESQFVVIPPQNVAGEMESKLLDPEQYVLACSYAWRNRSLNDIIQNERIIDYNPNDQMTFNYLKEFDLFDKDIAKQRHFVNRPESIILLLEAGLGYSVLTKEFSQPYVDNKQLAVLNEGQIYENQYALAWYPRHEPPPYFAALLGAIV